MPLLDNPQRPWKKAAFSQHPRGRVMGYSMRTERFRYTEWRDRMTNKLMAQELYNHEKDPQENVNAAAQPEYEHDIQRLAGMLKKAGVPPCRISIQAIGCVTCCLLIIEPEWAKTKFAHPTIWTLKAYPAP